MAQRSLELTYDIPFTHRLTRRKPVTSMTRSDISVRYPRLIHALQFVACLSEGEAISCIRDYQRGDSYSGEAVNHFGGTRAVISRAARADSRHASARTNRLIAERLRQLATRLG